MKREPKTTVTATFPGIGKVEISRERADQILRLQKIIREKNEELAKEYPPKPETKKYDILELSKMNYDMIVTLAETYDIEYYRRGKQELMYAILDKQIKKP